MNDETLIRLLGGLDQPVDPSPSFADRLYRDVADVRVHRRAIGVRPLLAAAAILVLALGTVSAFLLANRPQRPAVVPPPTPTVAVPTTADAFRPIAGVVASEIWSTTDGMNYSVTISAEGVPWMVRWGTSLEGDNGGTVIRLDPATGLTEEYDLPKSVFQVNAPAIGDTTLWVTTWTIGEEVEDYSSLWSMSLANPGVFTEEVMPPGVGAALPDEQGRQWFEHDGVIAYRTLDGTIHNLGRNPWPGRDGEPSPVVLNLPPAFGAAWAWQFSASELANPVPRLYRVDPQSGAVIASIDLPACDALNPKNDLPARLYPVVGVNGLPDSMLVACYRGGGVTGPLVAVNVATNSVEKVFDLGPDYRSVLVVDGHLLVVVGHQQPEETNQPTQLMELNPATGETSLVYEFDNRDAWSVDYTAGSLWWLSYSGGSFQDTHRLFQITPEYP